MVSEVSGRSARRPVAGHWERKSELVSGQTPGFGGALQVFGLVIGAA